MKTNYFKVDRDIQNNWLWKDKPFSRGQAWIDLLLLATHTDHKTYYNGQVITRRRGEVHTSIQFLAERWGWSRNKVYRFVEILTTEKMVTSNGTTNGTVITIENYAFYQGDYSTGGTTNETPLGTTDGTTVGHPSEHKQKGKESKRMFNNDLLSPEAQTKWAEIRKKVKS